MEDFRDSIDSFTGGLLAWLSSHHEAHEQEKTMETLGTSKVDASISNPRLAMDVINIHVTLEGPIAPSLLSRLCHLTALAHVGSFRSKELMQISVAGDPYWWV